MSKIFLILAIIISFHAHGSTVGKGCFNDNLKSPECRTTTFGDFYFMETEIWKKIDGYEYEVSTQGNVRRLENQRLMGFNKVIGNYLRVHLGGRKNPKSMSVHRLVATAFISNPENKPQVNHKNGIRNDNRLENLEWNTRKENIRHSYLVLGKKNPKGSDNSRAKPIHQYNRNGLLLRTWGAAHDASLYGFKRNSIQRCTGGYMKIYDGFVWSYKELSKEEIIIKYKDDRDWRATPVVQIYKGIRIALFKTLIEAAKINGVTHEAIWACAKGKIRSVNKCSFNYI